MVKLLEWLFDDEEATGELEAAKERTRGGKDKMGKSRIRQVSGRFLHATLTATFQANDGWERSVMGR